MNLPDPVVTRAALLAGGTLMAGAVSSSAEAAIFNLPRQGTSVETRSRLRTLLSRPHRVSTVLRTLDLLADVCFFGAAATLLLALRVSAPLVDVLMLTVGVAALFLLGEVLPRALGCRFPTLVLRITILPVELFYLLLSPLNLVTDPFLAFLVRPLERLGGGQDVPDEEELRGVLGYSARRGDLGQEGVDMVEGILDLDETRVSHVMTPRTRIEFMDADVSWDDALEVIASSPFRRFPLRRAGSEELEGVLYVKDLLEAFLEGERPLPREVARPALYIPGVAHLDDALNRMREAGYQMAVVVDEWGGIQGLVSMEDILEEIVGEIRDEHDEQEVHEEALAVRREGKIFDLDGALELDELGDLLGLDLEDLPIETLGGLVFHEHGSLPEVGAEVEFRGHRFRVTRRDRFRIARVQVTRKVL